VQQRSQRRSSLISARGSNGQSTNDAFTKKGEQIGRLESALESELDPPPIAQLFLAPPVADPASPLASVQQRRRLLSTLVEWVLGAAQVVPVVIAIEDLHWADPSTLELIELIIEQCAKAPLLLCTARPEFRAHWQPRSYCMQITLNPLNAYTAQTIVEKIAGQKILSEETITAVVERTGGVPLFVEELARAVLESGNVKHAKGEIPATLHDSLIARLDRLGTARETLQLGAVLGIEFTYELLLAISPLNENELRRHLLALTDAEHCTQRPSSRPDIHACT
jgi:predicted ATPase